MPIESTRRRRPIAIIAVRQEPVRDFLAVHLEDRGFAVELAHREEYLLHILPDATAVVCDVELLPTVAAHKRDGVEVLPVSDSPSRTEANNASRLGALDYFELPFRDTHRLASVLDAMAARAIDRLTRDEPARPEFATTTP